MEDAASDDRSEYLFEMFDHLPKACVLDTYENLYNRNFDLTVECLVNLTEDDLILYKNLAKESSDETNGTATTTATPSKGLNNFLRRTILHACERAY